MLSRRRTDTEHATAESGLTRFRDVVEILAILAAGLWAFYTFVYENQIKPANSRPEAQVETSLTRLGERNGLIAVASHIELKDVGVTEIWLYGIAETILGTTVRTRSDAHSAPESGMTEIRDETFWQSTKPTRVFAFAELTKLAAPRSRSGYNLRPGSSAYFDNVFYVPTKRFDELDSYVSLRFSAHDRPIPFRLETRNGVTHVSTSSTAEPDIEVDGDDGSFSTLSLWH